MHQPNFFPWLGLFHRIALVDKFIFFDHVQAQRGKSWLSRNKILLYGEVKWLTIPVKKRGRGLQKVHEVSINYDTRFEKKHLGTLRQSYGKCQCFNEVFPHIEELYAQGYERLKDFNEHYIRLVVEKIGIEVEYGSSLQLLNNCVGSEDIVGNELIVQICKLAKAETYISGEGCLDFIDPQEFEEEGIRFQFQKFVHPMYRQLDTGNFVSHLSSLDALFNIGFAGVRKIIDEAVHKTRTCT